MKHIKIFLIISMILLLFLVGCDDSSSSDSDGDGPDSEEDNFKVELVGDPNAYSVPDTTLTMTLMISNEESISTASYEGQARIAVDSKDQPHIVTRANRVDYNYYYKLGEVWYNKEPLLDNSGNRFPGLWHPFIEIDSKDRAWVSGSFVIAGVECAEWVGLIQDVADSTDQKVQWSNFVGDYQCEHDFVGNIDIDPYYPDNAFYQSADGVITSFSSDGSKSVLTNFYEGLTAGEYHIMKIAPNNNSPGIMHGLATIWYQNSNLKASGSNALKWVDSFYNDPNRVYSNAPSDHTYPGIGIDIKNPEAAYMAVRNVIPNGLFVNIFDGNNLLFSDRRLPMVDSNPLGDSGMGNGIAGRINPSFTPAKEGGTFLCWIGGNGMVKLIYMNLNGEFSQTIDVTQGTRCAIATDINGSIHMVYNNGGVKYRKIIPQVI